MKKRKLITYSLATVLLIGTAAAIYGYKEFNRKVKDTATVTPQFTVSAQGLLADFSVNEKTATAKYTDKMVEVQGMVKDVSKDEKGNCTVVLGDTASLSSVRCAVDSIYSTGAQNLTKGNAITVKGVCTGYNTDELLGSDVILVRSMIEKN